MVATSTGMTRTKLQSGLFHSFPLHPSYDHYSVHGVAITFEQVGDDWEKVLYDSARQKRCRLLRGGRLRQEPGAVLGGLLVPHWACRRRRRRHRVPRGEPGLGRRQGPEQQTEEDCREARAEDSRDWSARWEAALLQSELGDHEARNQMVEEVLPSDDDDDEDQGQERSRLKREREKAEEQKASSMLGSGESQAG